MTAPHSQDGGIPQAAETDAEDVVWALQTADTLWKRGERDDAIVWLRRAAQSAGDAQDDDRALWLARYAAELTEWLARNPGLGPGSLPPGAEAQPSVASLAVDDLLTGGGLPRFPSAPAPEEVQTQTDLRSLADEASLQPPPAPVEEVEAPPARSTGRVLSAAPSARSAAEAHAGLLDPWAEQSELSPRAAIRANAARDGRRVSVPAPYREADEIEEEDTATMSSDALSGAMRGAIPPEGDNADDDGVFTSARGIESATSEVRIPLPAQTQRMIEDPDPPGAPDVFTSSFNAQVAPPPPAGMVPPAPATAPMLNPEPDSAPDVEDASGTGNAARPAAPEWPAARPAPPPVPRKPPPPVPARPSPPRPPVPPRPAASVAPAPAPGPAPAPAAAQAPPVPAAPFTEPGGFVASASPSPPPPATPSPPPPSAKVSASQPAPAVAAASTNGDASSRVSPPSRVRTAPADPDSGTLPGAFDSVQQRVAADLRSIEETTRDAGKLDLSAIDAFADLPDDARTAFSQAATVHDLSREDEASSFALALVIDGEVDFAATIVDAPAGRLGPSAVLRARGTIGDGLPLRLIAASEKAQVATWNDAAVQAAFRTCPWVEDDLRAAADRVQALVGVTMGPLADRIDASIRNDVLGRLVIKTLAPGEVLVTKGEPAPGIVLVGVGAIEVRGETDLTVSPGEFLFASAVLGGGTAPATARAARDGAVILFGDRKIAQELMVTCPPLLELFAGM